MLIRVPKLIQMVSSGAGIQTRNLGSTLHTCCKTVGFLLKFPQILVLWKHWTWKDGPDLTLVTIIRKVLSDWLEKSENRICSPPPSPSPDFHIRKISPAPQIKYNLSWSGQNIWNAWDFVISLNIDYRKIYLNFLFIWIHGPRFVFVASEW